MIEASRGRSCLLWCVFLAVAVLVGGCPGESPGFLTYSVSASGSLDSCHLRALEDGGFLIAGNTDDDVVMECIGGTEGEGFVLRTDAGGEKLWETALTHEDHVKVEALEPLPDGSFVVTGSAGYTFDFHRAPYVARLSGAGDLEWLSTLEFTMPTDCYASFTNALRLAGDGTMEIARGYGKVTVDVSGTALSETLFDVDECRIGESLQFAPDGGYIGAGVVYTEPEAALAVRKLDPDGVEVWSKTYTFEYHDLVLTAIDVTGDGGTMLAGWLQILGAETDAFVLKLNPDGEEEWRRFYDRATRNSVNSIQCVSDGGCVWAGSAVDRVTRLGPLDFSSDRAAHIAKLDAQGNTEWETVVARGGWNLVLSDITEVPSGGYAAVGVRRKRNTSIRELFLLRLDNEGQLQALP